MTANIRPSLQLHEDCWQQDRSNRRLPGFVGDVRYCVHGKVQLLTAVPHHVNARGPGSHWWNTLSPIWNPILYSRAVQALTEEKKK